MRRTSLLLKTYLRRDWFKFVVWALCIVGLAAVSAGKFNSLYETEAAMASIIATLKTPAMVSMFGPMTATAPYTVAVIYAMEMMVFMGFFMAMMNIYFAVKNTRGEEDSGVLELTRARAVSRNAPLTAVISQLVIINVVMGVLLTLGLEVSGMNGVTIEGSLLFGISLAIFGMMFGGFSLLIAQLTDNSRGATIGSYVLLGGLFVLRMITDVQDPDTTWWTIYGWIEKLNIYDQNDWFPVLLMLVLTVVICTATVMLNRTRDVGSGLLVLNHQHKSSSRLINGPFSLLLRLERMPLIIWTLGMFCLGASYGSIFGQVGDLLATNPMMAKILGSQGTDNANLAVVMSFAGMLSVVFAVVSTIPAFQIIFKINRDERKGWLELIHANAVSRLKVYLSYLGLAVIISGICLFAAILGMYVSGSAAVDYDLDFSKFLRGFTAYFPAVLAVMGVGTFFVGLMPRLQNIVWFVPIYGFVSIYLGALLDFPKWAKQLTPYGWFSKVPTHAVPTEPLLLCLGIMIVLGIIGFITYRNRDLTVN